jgi:hypothetical protein
MRCALRSTAAASCSVAGASAGGGAAAALARASPSPPRKRSTLPPAAPATAVPRQHAQAQQRRARQQRTRGVARGGCVLLGALPLRAGHRRRLRSRVGRATLAAAAGSRARSGCCGARSSARCALRLSIGFAHA